MSWLKTQNKKNNDWAGHQAPGPDRRKIAFWARQPSSGYLLRETFLTARVRVKQCSLRPRCPLCKYLRSNLQCPQIPKITKDKMEKSTHVFIVERKNLASNTPQLSSEWVCAKGNVISGNHVLVRKAPVSSALVLKNKSTKTPDQPSLCLSLQ